MVSKDSRVRMTWKGANQWSNHPGQYSLKKKQNEAGHTTYDKYYLCT